jgi:LysM repeat protein
VEEQVEEQIVSGIEDAGQIQQKIADRELLDVVAADKDIIRFHSEVKLPNAKPNIERMLWNDVQLRNIESGIADGRIHIQGDIYFGAVYLCGDGTQLQWVDTILPFAKEVEGVDLKAEDPSLLWLTIHPESIDVEPENDYDGESRIFGIEIAFAVEYKVWSERKLPVLMDAYALDRRLNLKHASCESLCFLMKNEAKIRLQDAVSLDSNQEKILQILSCSGKITVDRTTVEENGLRFEGVATVKILYLTSDDNFPIAYTSCMLPFDQVVEVSGIQKDSRYDSMTSLDQLQVSLLDSSEFEVKAALRITVLAFSGSCFEKIESIEEEPLPVEELAGQPGLTGYVVQDAEELWDIAKRYHTTPEEIAATNNLKTAVVRPGTKLLIVKQINI